ncbi:MAG: DNA cytosine methyltransferase [Chamaesiphon sp.]|nr:DNA cytosine methyltransferase [Chamaesiphon sp.]
MKLDEFCGQIEKMVETIEINKVGKSIQKKLERLSKGQQPRVLDLFSGCGGMSLGFNLAGYKLIGGVENDSLAIQSYALNFHSHDGSEMYNSRSVARDITTTHPEKLMLEWGYSDPVNVVDVLIGGPPCPAFARVGRAKLREISQHPQAFKLDPRSQLYVPYIEYIKYLQPLVILMENVPDILNYGGHNLGEEISETLEELGYDCKYTLLNSASYGVPQLRERFFLVGIHTDVDRQFEFPTPTKLVNFPKGYYGSRQVALKHISQNSLFDKSHYVPTPNAPSSAGIPVTVEDAIKDLPTILGHLDGTMKRGARKFDKAVSYRTDIAISDYIKSMRCWSGFESDGYIYDHVTRSISNRDYRLFRMMSPGDDYPKANLLAIKLFDEAMKEMNISDISDCNYQELKSSYIPPYDPTKFPNKWRKMESDKPARTLMAHLGKDTYSHIHYDSDQARTISVREAARLQSFPDGFKFVGTMNPAFRQIGNAVPALMSLALANQILKAININVT